jgi:CRP-like cAMP-binding protein
MADAQQPEAGPRADGAFLLRDHDPGQGRRLTHDDACDLPITQDDLGDALGMSTVHVNRTLMMLRAPGLVEFRGGKLRVIDWEKLVETAEFDPTYLHLRP